MPTPYWPGFGSEKPRRLASARSSLSGQLNEQARAVAGQRVGSHRAAMGEVQQDADAVGDDGVALAVLDMGNEADAARIMLVARIVEALPHRHQRTHPSPPSVARAGLNGAQNCDNRPSAPDGSTRHACAVAVFSPRGCRPAGGAAQSRASWLRALRQAPAESRARRRRGAGLSAGCGRTGECSTSFWWKREIAVMLEAVSPLIALRGPARHRHARPAEHIRKQAPATAYRRPGRAPSRSARAFQPPYVGTRPPPALASPGHSPRAQAGAQPPPAWRLT